MSEINHILRFEKCQECGQRHDMIVEYKGRRICINCYYKHTRKLIKNAKNPSWAGLKL